MKWLALLALLLVAGLAQAGTLHACVINNNSITTGLLNDSYIYYNYTPTYQTDIFTSSLNTSSWVFNSEVASIALSTNTTSIMIYESGSNPGNAYLVNLLNFKSLIKDVNMTTQIGTYTDSNDDNIFIEITNTTNYLDPVSITTTLQRIHYSDATCNQNKKGYYFVYNATTKILSVQTDSTCVFTNTAINLTNYESAYLRFNFRNNGFTTSSIQLFSSITTKAIYPDPYKPEQLCNIYGYVGSWLLYNNATYSSNANVSNWTLLNYPANGTVTYSFNGRNFWVNYSVVTPLETGSLTFIINNVTNMSIPSILNLTVLDEENNVLSMGYNLTISNSSNTTYYGYYDKTKFSSQWQGIPNNVITLTFSNLSGYYSRSITIPFNQYPFALVPSQYNITAYLLAQSGHSALINFYARDAAGNAVVGATISAFLVSGSNLLLVQSGVTDASGAISFFLSQLSTYKIVATYQAQTASITIQPTSNSYTIFFGSPQGNFTGFFNNVTYTISPSVPVLFNPQGNTVFINFTVSSPTGTLNGYGFNITYWNGTEMCNVQDNTVTGGTLACALNDSNLNTNVTALFWIRQTGFSVDYTIPIVYTIGEQNTIGLLYSAKIFETYGTPWFTTLLVIVLCLLTAIAVSRFMGFGSSIVVLGTLAVCAYAGLIEPVTVLLVGLLVAGLLVTGRIGL